VGDHDGHDERDLDDCDGHSQDQRAERLADAVCNNLGVVDGRKHGRDQHNAGNRQHDVAAATNERRAEHDPCQQRPRPTPPRYRRLFDLHSESTLLGARRRGVIRSGASHWHIADGA
jgi:hypothetical protein